MKQFILLLLIGILSLPVAATSSSFDLSSQDDKEVEVELKIYPNPVRQNQVTVSLDEASFVELRLVNITGREILSEKFDSPLHKKVVRLYNVPNGIYIMQIKTDDQRLIAKKVSVSRK